jgi:hypothetical protein
VTWRDVSVTAGASAVSSELPSASNVVTDVAPLVVLSIEGDLDVGCMVRPLSAMVVIG